MREKQKAQRVRHCMVVHGYYPFDETRVQRQAEALHNGGYAVDVICLRHSSEPRVETIAGVSVHRLPLRRNKKRGPVAQFLEYLAFLILAFLRVTVLHLRRPYCVVQVHNPPDFLVFASLVPRLTGGRVILDLHDLMPEFYCSKFNSSAGSWVTRVILWQEWLCCRFAHHVITVTDFWRRSLADRSVSPDRCTVVMNVPDSRYFNRYVHQDNGRDDGHFCLLYHGTLTYRYGLDVALRALDQVRKEIPNIRLRIQGRGEHLQDLIRLVEESGLRDEVHIDTEYVPIERLPKLIMSAHLGLVPYRRDVFTDGILPTKLMEYAALGLPSIVARTPCITAYFDETMVEFFNPDDSDDLAQHIALLYRNNVRLRELARNITVFTQRYHWSRQSAEYVSLVERLSKPRQGT